MKKLFFVLCCMLPMGVLLAQELSVDEITSKNLKAIGQEKLMSIQTIKMTGKMSQGGMEFQITQFQKKPDIARQEIEIQGMKIIMVVTGDTGWTINPMTGSTDVQDLPSDVVKNMIKEGNSDPSLNWDNPFYNWKEKGTKVELVGKEDLSGTQVYNLKFIFNDGNVINYYVDADKFIVLKDKSIQTEQGQTYNKETNYSDYRDIDGIFNPGRVEIIINGQVSTVFTVDKCELSIPIDESIFKKPV